MERDDLTTVKYIGASRMKSLNDSGITTIKQLSETPIEELIRISTIGMHYAKLIKTAASEAYQGKPREMITPKDVFGKEEIPYKIKHDFNKKIKALKKRLNLASEGIMSLKKKKHQKLYPTFKKRSEILMNLLRELTKTDKDLSGKFLNKTAKKIDSLSALLKNPGKKFKKKKLKRLFREIDSFSNMLKKTIS